MLYYDYQVLWADLDANNHLRNTGYLDYASQTRMRFLADHGFTPEAFARQRLGPIVFEDKVVYRKELRLLEPFRVSIETRGRSANGAKFILVNRIYNQREELCAEVQSHGAWFSLAERRIVEPPAELMAAMEAMPKTGDYAVF